MKAPSAQLQAVLDWSEEYNGDSEYKPESETVEFEFTRNSVTYTGTCLVKYPGLLTITIVLEVSPGHDELTLRRKISVIDLANRYGALVFHHELQLVIWRDSIYAEKAEEFDADLVEGVIACGIESMEAMILELPDVFGRSNPDVRLAQQVPQGRA